MKSYKNIEDLLTDKSFKDWVLKEDPALGFYWQKWQADNQGKLEMLEQAKRVLLELDAAGKDWDDRKQDLLFDKIKRRINSNNKNKTLPNKNRHYPKNQYWARAAMITFLVVASLLAYVNKNANKENEKEYVLEQKEAIWITKSNPKGQKSKIRLPDGSRVNLNAASEIRFRSDFGQNDRDIVLQGESFFEVAPDSLLPFRVFSGDLVTTALGTSFNINSYYKDRIQIQLATGKVRVMNELKEEEPMYLIPGEEMLLDRDNKMKKKKFDPKKAFLWKDGILLFEKTSFSDFKATLERWYGVEIDVENQPLLHIQISGEFQDTYLTNILESIGYAYGFDYKVDHKKVKINFNLKENI